MEYKLNIDSLFAGIVLGSIMTTTVFSMFGFLRFNAPVEPIKPIPVDMKQVAEFVSLTCNKGVQIDAIVTEYSVTIGGCYVNRGKK